jgi:hypothetical protein
MTFDRDNWNSVSRSTTAPKPVMYTYVSTDDALATIATSAYFNDVYDQMDENDLIYVVGSDGTGLYRVTSDQFATPVTVAAFDTTPAGSIVNADISASAAIAFSKLASLTNGSILIGNGSNAAAAVAISHVVKFAGNSTTPGGSATVDITVTGAATTDLVFAQLKTAGATPRTILTATIPSTNTVRLVFSGDPSTDHVVAYQVLRAAAS